MPKQIAIVHHADRRRDVHMPYAPAIVVRRGDLVCMENLKKTLAAAGATLGDVVMATRFLTDVDEQDDLNRVWAAYLGDHLPTTTTVEVSRLATHARCKIEINAIAVTEGR